ncbi:hypothetical protein RHMOL_Rhmol10G0223000 [Rhododendron molle]|uniref:Uncharacterized protein n=1 Tax=Rhododendron molle TaxID=49168 RepID=A0ACC0M6R3_RHOML|nr:hypothetical protein RHMOL_Rhmol10G0223000 [Rhododendron molle]
MLGLLQFGCASRRCKEFHDLAIGRNFGQPQRQQIVNSLQQLHTNCNHKRKPFAM